MMERAARGETEEGGDLIEGGSDGQAGLDDVLVELLWGAIIRGTITWIFKP